MSTVIDVQEVQQELDEAARDARTGSADIRAGRFVHGNAMATTSAREVTKEHEEWTRRCVTRP
jgi:hypothetical protein